MRTCVIILGTVLCRPLQNNNVNDQILGCLMTANILNYVSNVSMSPRFSSVIALTVTNKVNDFGVPQDSCVKYKITLNRRSPRI